MSVKRDVYKCSLCGNIVEELWNGKTEPQCCDQTMQKFVVNTVEASKEKHIPVIIRDGEKVTVKVGSVAHPMTKEHYILFVEVLAGNKVYRQDFTANDAVAEATFIIPAQDLVARALCNLHGFWSTI
jgi:superoxide reductase